MSNESCFPETANLSLWLLKLKEQRLCRAPRGALAWRYPSALGGALGMVVRFSVLFHALDERKWGQAMTEENFYITDSMCKKTGPFSAREIGNLQRRSLMDPTSVVTDSAGVLQTELQRFDADANSKHQPPPPIPPLEEKKARVASEDQLLLRRTILMVLATSAVRLNSWLFAGKRPPRTGGNSSGPPKPLSLTELATPFNQLPIERLYPQKPISGERP